MKKTLTLTGFFIACFSFSSLFAQLSEGGKPISFSQKAAFNQFVTDTREMPALDLELLQAEDKINDRFKDIPWRFGKRFDVNLNPKNSGTWVDLEDGRLWTLGIVCKEALSVNLVFNTYRLPEGASLFAYSADRSYVLGAFTSANNQDDGIFAIHPIPGETIVLEYFEPSNVEFSGALNIGQVVHGYRDINAYAKAFGSSGDCNVNANCPEGDPINNEIRATVMMILTDGLCTGTLINNTLNDGTPYILSANHCYGSPGAVVFRFNWESEACEEPSVSPSYTTLSGAVDRATYPASDMWLLEMNDVPPADYEVFYAGWNRTSLSVLEEKVWCVHHPAGDIKKISWSNEGIASSTLGGMPGSGTNYWRVSSWSDGTTTEVGSSGSALLDNHHLIIGQLYGGTAECGNTDPDWFGKLSVSWIGDGTKSGRLSNWLDPDETGFLTQEGFDPAYLTIDGGIFRILTPLSVYEAPDTLIPSVVIRNNGADSLKAASVYYWLNEMDSVGIDWTGGLAFMETDTVLFPEIILRLGLQSFSAGILLEGDENSRNDYLTVEFNVADCRDYSLPVFESFDSLKLSPCYNITLVEGTTGSLATVDTGSYPVSIPLQGMRMLEFNSESANVGAAVRLETPPVSTLGMDSITLSFDWLHDMDRSYAEDRLQVQYSFDGIVWLNVHEFMRHDELLEGWYRKEILLPNTVDHKTQLFLGLYFISGNGNNCHMDSLVIEATSIDEPYPEFFASALEAATGDTVFFTDNSYGGPYISYDWDFGEGAVPHTAEGQGPHIVVYETPGDKTVSLTLDELYTETKTNFILVDDNVFFVPFNLRAEAVLDTVFLNWNWKKLEDGFESGDLRLWGDMIEGAGVLGDTVGYPYWYVLKDAGVAYNGSHLVKCDWGYNLDTWLISPEMEVTDHSRISFIWQSSYYWHVQNDHGDLFVKISSDKGVTWNKLWTFGNIGEWDDWAWYETTIDISEFADNEVLVAFNQVANDNAEVLVDNVRIDNVLKKQSLGTRKLTDAPQVDLASRYAPDGTQKVNGIPEKQTSLVDYTVFRDGVEIGSSLVNSYMDEGLKPGDYSYYIVGNYTDPEYTTEPSDTVTIEVGEVGVPEPGREASVRVFPNPSTGVFSFQTAEKIQLRVTDLRGRVIREETMNRSNYQLDLSDQPDGIYFFHLTNRHGTTVIKAIIQSE